ncbi:hypothetical protein M0R45_025236 [Rubus argutus]|uniref:Uncharacterized protein n=1 Tax=Rubus argutus TaxID=59490 RepID=A0AAW1WXG9_RUBAR
MNGYHFLVSPLTWMVSPVRNPDSWRGVVGINKVLGDCIDRVEVKDRWRWRGQRATPCWACGSTAELAKEQGASSVVISRGPESPSIDVFGVREG